MLSKENNSVNKKGQQAHQKSELRNPIKLKLRDGKTKNNNNIQIKTGDAKFASKQSLKAQPAEYFKIEKKICYQ